MRYAKVKTHLTPDRCRAIRECLGWSQEQLAEAAQCSLSTVRNYENDKVIRFNTVLALDKVLTETGKVNIHSHGFEFKEGNKVETYLTPCKCKLIRSCLRWTQEQLAEAANCSPSIIRNYENDKVIDFNTVLVLDKVLTETGKVRIYSNGFKFKEGNEAWRYINYNKL